ncbi:hypothetical protein Y032_0130g1561 [Ancylostoma ceylanicum]|uniref:Uncharacterized protein n=1 Tax=Ancylostoma ceylanicum TaxID=53326 RepID=A0A016T7B0_9BILA|nr:hypothetical protein Y032_0130g1561 [Ancylostoma ceylanicum]
MRAIRTIHRVSWRDARTPYSGALVRTFDKEIGLEAGPVFRWPLGRCECLTQLWDNVTHSENAHFPSSESSCVFQDLFENKTNSA